MKNSDEWQYIISPLSVTLLGAIIVCDQSYPVSQSNRMEKNVQNPTMWSSALRECENG